MRSSLAVEKKFDFSSIVVNPYADSSNVAIHAIPQRLSAIETTVSACRWALGAMCFFAMSIYPSAPDRVILVTTKPSVPARSSAFR